MENTMRSIIKHITDNFSLFGLASTSELKVVERPKSSLTDGGKWLTVLSLQTIPDESKGVPLVAPDASERSLTLVEIECKMRTPEPSKDFLWNNIWKFRDQVISALAGPGETGIVITRYGWANPQNPVADGQIWFSANPLEKHLEDPADPANKSIFLTYNVHWWKSQVETVAVDSWLEALAVWTEGVIGAGWTVYRGAWPLGYVRPSVMWRLTGTEIQEKSRAMYEVRKRFVGHVLGRSQNEQVAGAVTLTQELGKVVKVVLDAVGKRYLIVKAPVLNLQADALSAGQLSVLLSRSTNRPTEEVPYIMQVQGSGSLS